MLCPALARRHPADHFRAVGDGLLAVEGALRPCKALADNLGIFINEYGHNDLR